MKKLTALLFAVLLLIMMPGMALAEEAQSEAEISIIISPMWVYINSAYATLDINDSGRADMTATIQCLSGGVDKIRISAYLQRYDGGWVNVNHWSNYYYSWYANWSQSYYVTSGYTYRLYVYFYAYDGDILIESTTRSDSEYY